MLGATASNTGSPPGNFSWMRVKASSCTSVVPLLVAVICPLISKLLDTLYLRDLDVQIGASVSCCRRACRWNGRALCAGAGIGIGLQGANYVAVRRAACCGRGASFGLPLRHHPLAIAHGRLVPAIAGEEGKVVTVLVRFDFREGRDIGQYPARALLR